MSDRVRGESVAQQVGSRMQSVLMNGNCRLLYENADCCLSRLNGER